MPSARSRWLARGLRVVNRPLAGVVTCVPGVVEASAPLFDATAVVAGLVTPRTTGMRIEAIRYRIAGRRPVIGEWIRPAQAAKGSAMLYIHGGGYAVCSPRTHRPLTVPLAARTGLNVFSLAYRQGSRHPFHAAAQDALSAWRWLRAQGLEAQRIVVAGDSAGGHVAIDLAAELCRRGEPGPAGLVLFSPLIDPTFDTAAERDAQRPDPMVSAAAARRVVALYTRGADADDPRLALLRCDARGLPPMLLQVGELEMLSAEGERFAAFIHGAGGSCELEVWAGQVHVFQAFGFLPEARAALRRAAAFAREALETAASADDAAEARRAG